MGVSLVPRPPVFRRLVAASTPMLSLTAWAPRGSRGFSPVVLVYSSASHPEGSLRCPRPMVVVGESGAARRRTGVLGHRAGARPAP
eukprot:1209570-Alexandrium_andersonii.AAC.1